MRVAIPSSLCHYSLWVSAVLDHFGYPAPHLDQWQQCVWYDLGAAQESLYLMCNCLARGLPAVASLLRCEPSLSLQKPTSMPIHPSHGGKFIKASKGGGPPSCTSTTGHSSSTETASPKTEIKKKKKKWAVAKCTITSETISPPEKKRKLISESPNSEAEGPFRDSDRTESAPEYSPPAPQ